MSYGSVTIKAKGDGSKTEFTFPFEYIKQSNIHVFLLNETNDKFEETTEWTLKDNTIVKFNTAPPAPTDPDVDNVQISRITDDDKMAATFNPGSAIRARDLNDNYEQLLFLIQENKKGISENADDIYDDIRDLQGQIDKKVETITGTAPIVASRTEDDVTISITNATTSADGAMSKEDKTKLDNIPTDAASGTVKKVTGVAPVEVTTSSTEPEVSMKAANSSRDGYMPKEYAKKLDSVQFVEVHNATFTEYIDGTRKTFTLNKDANSAFDLTVSINGIIQQANVHYTWDSANKQITFTSAPPVGSEYWITISGFQMADGSVGGYQTTATLPLANHPNAVTDDPESVARLEAKLDEQGVLYQSDLNEENFFTLFNQRRKGTRDRTRIDFIQNIVVEGDWDFDQAVVNAELPESGSFNMYKEDGTPTNDYGEVSEITFNGTDRYNKNNLAEVRRGATLIIFDVILNSFAQFVIDEVSTIGSIEGGQFWATYKVRVAFGRNVGTIPNDATCEIRVISSYPCIATRDGSEPIVDNDGYLWYNEVNKTLYVSDWDDDQDNNGDAVWIPVGGESMSSEGGGVHVGEDEPADPAEGDLWFDTGRLELYVYYVEDEDGGWLPTSPLGARVSAGEALQAEINSRLTTVESKYLSKTGGTTTGQLEVTRPGETQAGKYIFSVKADGLEDGRQVAFRVTADGAVKVGHDTSHPFMASSNNDVVSKKFADDTYALKGEGGSGGSFQTKYDGNRLCIGLGFSTTNLSSGEVMYLNNQLTSTNQPALVEVIGLPLQDFDWTTCIKSGVIKVQNGSNKAGYYQVFDIKENEGRNMLVYVKNLWADVEQLLEEGGTPCYFQGVFFE